MDMIAKNNLCIGCGICAGMCPANALKMEFNKYGEYNPVIHSECLKNCDLCRKVCPFNEQIEDEKSLAAAIFSPIEGIKYRAETGYYLDSYAGYCKINDQRANSASGGMTTWLLEILLIKNIVDHVVCVTPCNDSEKLFRFTIFDKIASIRSSAKSAYYPVEMSEIVKQILAKEGRYVITGLPCFIKSLRLAIRVNKKLRERIMITVGLVCGQLKSKHYTRYLALLAGINGELEYVVYRGKRTDKPANNFFFQCVNTKNKQAKLFWDEGVSTAWNNRWFTPDACNFCDDVFAELADISMMDAWLPEYYKDGKGTNLLIVRSPLLQEIIEEGIRKDQIYINRIPINTIIKAQLGVVNVKRNQLSYRLYLAKKNGLSIENKKVLPSRNISFINKKDIYFKDKMQRLSKDLFIEYFKGSQPNLEAFSQEMNWYVNKLKRWQRINRLVHLPLRAIDKLARLALADSINV